MRWRPFTWFLLSVMFFAAAAFFWRLGNDWEAKKQTAPAPALTNQSQPLRPSAKPAAQVGPIRLLTQPGTLNARSTPASANSDSADRFANRLSNTPTPLHNLVHSDTAILLQNALIDTERPLALSVPDHL